MKLRQPMEKHNLNRSNNLRERESGSQFVDGLMERQDEVLIQLDLLNASIESMIMELTAQRSQNAAAQDAFPEQGAQVNTMPRRAVA